MMHFHYTAYRAMMLAAGKDDLRNRIPPRFREFHTNSEGDNPKKGTVAWYSSYLKKDYCQSTMGYTCKRASVAGSGAGGQGEQTYYTYISFAFCI